MVTTPTEKEFVGEVVDVSQITAVSIIRAGDSMLDAFMAIAPEASVGIQCIPINMHIFPLHTYT